MGHLDNGMLVGAQAAYEAQNFCDPAALEFSLAEARRRLGISMDSSDIVGEIDTDELVQLVKEGNANAIGRYVLAQMAAWQERLARRDAGVAS